MTQNNMEVVAHLLQVPDGKPFATSNEYLVKIAKSEGWKVEPLVTLTSTQAEIAVQKQANEALMRERATMIATHREQLDRLTKERDEWRDHVLKQNGNVAHNIARAEAAEKERDALRDHLAGSMDALILAQQSMEWFTSRYPEDTEITAHKIHLRRVNAALQPLEPKND